MSDFAIAQEIAAMTVTEFRRFKKGLMALRRAGLTLPEAIYAIRNAQNNKRYRVHSEIE